MEVIAVVAAEAKAAAEERAAGAPPKRSLGRPRKEPVLVLGALPPLPAAQPQKADGEARQHANWFLPALIAPILRAVAKWTDYVKAVRALHDEWPTVYGKESEFKLPESPVRGWFVQGSYTKLKRNYQEAVERSCSAHKPESSGRL
jgi:hypothetical protein